MSDLIPRLKEVQVNPFDLLLDPNNPRYFSDDKERVKDSEIAHPEIQERAQIRMRKYAIQELQDSILQNSYVPTDAIFVTLHRESGRYLVREGNRRVTALKGLIMNDEALAKKPKLKEQLSSITVLLVESTGDDNLLNKQMSYLLGVRHHGSLKKWTPFARAQNAIKHYFDVTGQDAETFRWDEGAGKQIAQSLSVSSTEIHEGFRVYRAMQQVDADDLVQKAGGIPGNLYSFFKEMLAPKRKELRKFIPQDPVTLRLVGDDIVEKLDKICHFTTEGRNDAPIKWPQEWASFNSILADDDVAVREENIRRVVEEKINPSVVWVQRQQELKRLDWSKWLEKVNLNLVEVNIGQMKRDPKSEEFAQAIAVLTRLDEVIQVLTAKTKNS